jgi:hypothetical protein
MHFPIWWILKGVTALLVGAGLVHVVKKVSETKCEPDTD